VAKVRYLRECYRHPKRTKNLRYIYTMEPDVWYGQLMCRDCRDDYDKRNMSFMRENSGGG